MGLTKTTLFTDEQNALAALAKVLGHPARVAIIQKLVELNSCVCGDLVTDIGLAQATISQHLKELKKMGLIKGTIEGTSVCYCLDMDQWKQLEQQFNTLFQQINTAAKCC